MMQHKLLHPFADKRKTLKNYNIKITILKTLSFNVLACLLVPPEKLHSDS